MKWPGLTALLLLLAGAVVFPGQAFSSDPQDATDAWSPRAADSELVRRVLDESGVDQTVQGPSWSAYPQTLAEAFAERLALILRPFGPRVLAQMKWLAGALTGVAFVLLVIFSTRALTRRRSRQRSEELPDLAEETREAGQTRDREAWRRAFEERCAAADVAGALEALWWYLATSIAPRDVDPSWTSRELLEEASRQELMPLARGLDRMIYGSLRPAVPEVRLFFGQLRRALA